MRPSVRRRGCALVATAVTLLAATMPRPAAAHELEEASVALVVRADGLVELRLMVPWAAVLRAQLAPQLDPVALLTQLVNQSPPAFAGMLAPIEARMMRELRLVDVGTGRPFTQWRWPSAADVQAALREELMSRLADGAAFRHASRLPATAALRAVPSARQAHLALPALLGPVLLTVTHPQEQMVPSGQRSRTFPLRPPA